MSQCKAWLDNYTGNYYPGSQIQGKVILNFDSETKLRAVKVRIICHEHTEFSVTETYLDPVTNEQKTRDTLARGDNDAFATEINLYGGHGSTSSLPGGQHMYPFSIILPTTLPGSYNCDYGSIHYKLIATVDRPMAFDYEDELIFMVVAPVDLNLLRRPDLLESSSYSDDKTLCCWCCAQGPISLDVELPKKTLIPGETVNITARLSNMSNTNIEGVQLILQQSITCRVEEPSREERVINNDLLELNEVGLGAHGEHAFIFPVMLPINISVPNFSMCKLFQIEYRYKVVAKLPGVHTNLEIVIYPEVGNIQIGQAPGGFGNHPSMPISYPPATGAGYLPTTGGIYPQPPVGGVAVFPPSAPPPVGFNPKAQEAAGLPTSGFARSEPPPPSYDSINIH